MARILKAQDKGALSQAVTLLKQGDVVAFPTETVYGLGASVFNAKAVARIFEVKQRPSFDPLIVHIAHISDLAKLTTSVDERIHRLAECFWPGPLTLVLPKHPRVPDIVTAGLDTVAVRIPAHPDARALIEALGEPIAAPSANPFSYVSPTQAQHVQEQLGNAIELILDGGASQVGLESTILSLVEESSVILRPGFVTAEDLRSVLGDVPLRRISTDKPSAPGQLSKHYATQTPLVLWRPNEALPKDLSDQAYLGFQGPIPSGNWAHSVLLSAEGNFPEAAAALFAVLRALDGQGFKQIIAECMPEKGLGIAIMDRLQRCAVNKI